MVKYFLNQKFLLYFFQIFLFFFVILLLYFNVNFSKLIELLHDVSYAFLIKFTIIYFFLFLFSSIGTFLLLPKGIVTLKEYLIMESRAQYSFYYSPGGILGYLQISSNFKKNSIKVASRLLFYKIGMGIFALLIGGSILVFKVYNLFFAFIFLFISLLTLIFLFRILFSNNKFFIFEKIKKKIDLNELHQINKFKLMSVVFLSTVFIGLTYAVCILEIKNTISFKDLFYIIFVSSIIPLISTISTIPSGLGVTELSATYLYSIIGVSFEMSVAAAIMVRLTTFIAVLFTMFLFELLSLYKK